jgi:PEP-CTERM motif
MRNFLFAAATGFILISPAAGQVFTPITFKGYTDDVIADAMGAPSATTTAAFDFGIEPIDNSVLFEQGYDNGSLSVGVPSNGTLNPSANRTYQLGPIAGKNSLRLTQSSPAGRLTLMDPAREAVLSLLLAASDDVTPADGGVPATVTVNWTNGRSSNINYTVYDWYQLGTPGPNSGVAIGGLNRVDRTTGVPNEVDLTLNPTPMFAIYYYDIDLTADPNYIAGALVESVDFSDPEPLDPHHTLNVMGLSGATAVPEPGTLTMSGIAAVGWAMFWRRRWHCNAPSATLSA